MMYKVIKTFTDIQDNHVYFAGDKYPHKGAKVTDKRIKELSGAENRLGYPLIKAVENEDEAEHVLDSEQPKKRTKSRKKGE